MAELPAAVDRVLGSVGLPAVVLGRPSGPEAAAWPVVEINRVDLAADVLGVAMADFRPEEWVSGWVGYAEQFSVWGTSRRLETVYFGSRESSVYLRVYDKVAEATKGGDLAYWRQAWGGWSGPVARVCAPVSAARTRA